MTTPSPGTLSPYRFPPYLDLYAEEEVIEAELIEDTELTRHTPSPEFIYDAEVVEDALELEGCFDPRVTDDPADIVGPEPEKPTGVRVAWKRPTDLFAEAGTRVTARGMDLTAALSERARGKVGEFHQEMREGTWHLAPMNPFGQDAPHRSMPEPETISRG